MPFCPIHLLASARQPARLLSGTCARSLLFLVRFLLLCCLLSSVYLQRALPSAAHGCFCDSLLWCLGQARGQLQKWEQASRFV